ncbi:uncharacterized protein B0T23DRAFT_376187 [Neurospora hispaniola]|uniref:Uncharacterized protein n=1 Tax=Neurospora hispaniola TaxID=588809 RepID=A0AAJ0I9B3_9PEZI|nr:hypothetical protein B0T23DRAFT_376187 [Neurospora hispaniola]
MVETVQVLCCRLDGELSRLKWIQCSSLPVPIEATSHHSFLLVEATNKIVSARESAGLEVRVALEKLLCCAYDGTCMRTPVDVRFELKPSCVSSNVCRHDVIP